MAVEISVVVSIISAIVAIVSLIANTKKSNKTDGFELGNFMGEMRAEISSIKELIGELKKDNKEVDEKIIKAIHDHELHYDDKISRLIVDHEVRYHNH